MMAMGMSPLIGWNTFNDHSPCTVIAIYTVDYQLLFSLVYALGTIVTTVFIMTVIVLVLYKLSPHYNDANSSFRHSRKLKKTYLVLTISTSFILCWGPYLMVTCVRMFDLNVVPGDIIRWALLPSVINVGFNWMIYGLGNTKFRQAMTAIVKGKQHIVIAGSFSS